MIAILTGKVLSKKPTQSIIDCGGVGYEIFHTPYTAEKIPQKEVRLFIHTHVREDALQLFGFYEEEEKEVFRELLKVSAVGPKLALSILSGIPFRELIQALQTKDIQRLQKIPGIGKKTAERLSVEMADRIAKNIHILSAPLSVTGLSSNKQQELESILINLGYQKAEVTRAVAKVSDGLENEAIEISLKKALGELTDIKQSARLN